MSRIRYHKKEKILSVRLQQKRSVESEVKDNVVIDYGPDGEVVNIDIMAINLNNFVPVRQRPALAVKTVS